MWNQNLEVDSDVVKVCVFFVECIWVVGRNSDRIENEHCYHTLSVRYYNIDLYLLLFS